MSGEFEKLNAGATDLRKKQIEQEEQIRHEVEATLPNMGPEAQEAVIQSRLKILSNSGRPVLIQEDFGENASQKVKDKLFE